MLRSFSLRLLLRVEVSYLEHFGLRWHPEGQLALHVVKSLVDLDEAIEEGRSGLDERLSQLLPRAVEHLEADVTFPEGKHLADQVMLEEVHRGQHVEERRLVHPLRQSHELGRHLLDT